jgi:hypothetical protein
MSMGGTVQPSVTLNDLHRLQPTLAGLLDIFTLDLLTPLGIAEGIGYAFPLWYVFCLSLKSSISLTSVALARTGLITDAALPLMLRHQAYSSNLLLKQGTI